MIKEFKKYLSLIFKIIFEEKIHKELTLKAKILLCR